MKKILITGASGFFGQHVVKTLLAREEQIQLFCPFYDVNFEFDDSRVFWIQSNLLEVERHSELMESISPTHCIHLAWSVPPQAFWHSFDNVTWLYASMSLFKTFCEVGGKVFMGAGSTTEYDWSTGVLDEENTPLQPSTLYGQTKRSLHELLIQFRNKHYPHVAILWPRIGYFFGEGEPPQKLVSLLCKNILQQSPMNLMAATTLRPYASVTHAGKVLAEILVQQESDLIFNLSASKGHTLEEIATILGATLEKPFFNLIFDGYKPPIPEPEQLFITTQHLDALGLAIPNTLENDLQNFAHIFKKCHEEIL